MKRTALLLASLLLCGSIAWGASQPAVNPAASNPTTVSADSQASTLLAAIFQTPQPQNAATPVCLTQTRCSNGLWLGCNGYSDPTGCETYRNCVVCDGIVYRCPNGFCPY
ncbi:MAG TPA: hypothetical protein VF173_35070 [Thermoanaerobaculia bacterium]|nr:hypothetical protein [Thermoanaerobaculia bacterium]